MGAARWLYVGRAAVKARFVFRTGGRPVMRQACRPPLPLATGSDDPGCVLLRLADGLHESGKKNCQLVLRADAE